MIKVRKDGDDFIVSLFQVNKLNTLFTGIIESELTDLLGMGSKKIYFDLNKIKFIDSSGFDMLLRLDLKARQNGTQFIICNIKDEVEELFSLMKIGDKINIEHKNLKSEPLFLEVD